MAKTPSESDKMVYDIVDKILDNRNPPSKDETSNNNKLQVNKNQSIIYYEKINKNFLKILKFFKHLFIN